MMQAKSAFVWGLLAATGIYWGGQALKEPLRHWTNPYTYRLSDGTVVETIKPAPNEIAETLQMKRWRFHITLPQSGDADSFVCGIELRKDGKPASVITEFPFHVPQGRSMDVAVCFSPENHNWYTGRQFDIWDSDNFPPTGDATSTGSRRYPNPFVGMDGGMSTYTSVTTFNDPHRQKDQSFVLMAVRKPFKLGPKTVADDGNAIEVVFIVKAINYRKHYGGNATLPVRQSLSNRPLWEAWFR